jgi:hypothetical protein
MHVALHTALVVAALASAGYLLVQTTARAFALIALACAGIELLLGLHVLGISFAWMNIDDVLAAGLALGGAVSWWRATARGPVAAATIVALIGVMQLGVALHLLR